MGEIKLFDSGPGAAKDGLYTEKPIYTDHYWCDGWRPCDGDNGFPAESPNGALCTRRKGHNIPHEAVNAFHEVVARWK